MTLAAVRKDPKIVFLGAAATVLGFLLAAFYIIPAAYEQRWVNIAYTLLPGSQPMNNFLFRTTGTLDPNWVPFKLMVSTLALAEMVVTAIAVLLSRNRRHTWPALWWTLMVLSAVSAMMMFPVSTTVWHYLPKVQFVQYPWRWLLVLNLALAIQAAAVITKFRRRVVTWALVSTVLLVGLGALAVRLPGIRSDFTEAKVYPSTPEYVPRGFQRIAYRPNLPEVEIESGESKVQVQHWGTESKSLIVDATQPALLGLRLANYPAWIIKVNGITAHLQPHENRSEVMVPAGHSQVEVNFARTADRTIGGALSLAAAALLFFLELERISRRTNRES